MKKSFIVLIVAGLVLGTTALWLFNSQGETNTMDLIHFGVIMLVVGFAIFLGVQRLRNVKRGEPAEDELSKKVLQRTAATSYYISLYIWVFLLFLKDRVRFDTEQLLGTGILAMAVTFGVVWLLYNFRGISNE